MLLKLCPHFRLYQTLQKHRQNAIRRRWVKEKSRAPDQTKKYHSNIFTSRPNLLPPGLEPRAEVRFGPGREDHHVGLVDVGVRQREGQGGGAADHLALVVVLRAVARALEFVLCLVPGHDAPEVRAHGVDAVVLNAAVILHHEVRGVTLLLMEEGKEG